MMDEVAGDALAEGGILPGMQKKHVPSNIDCF
jgi:hypothetical protein